MKKSRLHIILRLSFELKSPTSVSGLSCRTFVLKIFLAFVDFACCGFRISQPSSCSACLLEAEESAVSIFSLLFTACLLFFSAFFSFFLSLFSAVSVLVCLVSTAVSLR